MGFGLLAAIGGPLISGLLGKSGADEQADAARAGIGEQRRQFDLSREDLAPFREASTGALGRLNALSTGDLTGFQTSPGFEFRRSEGQRDIGSSFAAGGLGKSGNALRALTEFNQGLASQEFGNQFQQQLQLAGLGGQGVQAGVQAGQQTAGNISNLLANQGAARASGLQNINQAIQGGISNFLINRGLNEEDQAATNFLSRQGFR